MAMRKVSSILSIIFLFTINGWAQKINLKADLLLMDSFAKQQEHHHEKRAYIFKNQPKTFKNSNPVSWLYGGSLFVYQNYVSQHFSANCLYHPSCSDFSKGVVKADCSLSTALTVATGLQPPISIRERLI
jgi:hypothetical protein